MDPAILGSGLGVIGLGALVFAALKFRPEQTGMLIAQVTQMTESMDTLNAEMRKQRDEAIAQRDQLREQNQMLQDKLDRVVADLADARSEIAQLSDQIAQLQQSVDGGDS